MRVCLCLFLLAAISLHAAAPPKSETVRGKLVAGSGEAPALETAEHQRIVLDGDTPTRKVLHDPRVNGFEVEARGHFTAPGKFLIDPQHTRALVVRDGGKLKMITYWCDVCYIRAYARAPRLCGVPFLAPWANRLDGDAYWANGKRYLLNPNLGNVRRDGNQKPIHGLLGFS